MDNKTLEAAHKALEIAKEKLNQAIYLSECGNNQGLRQMNANKADWLGWVVYLAERGFKAIEDEDRLAAEQELAEDENVELICDKCLVSAEAVKLIEQKDKTIKELCDKLTEVTEHFKSLQVTYDCEVEYRKALAQRAKIDHFAEVLKVVHDRCWLDGTVLVTPVEYIDRSLLELIKE